MSARIHLLAKTLLGKDSLQASDTDAVRALVEKYPFCAPARFLLVQQLKSEEGSDYGTELGRAVLYYHHPVQLAGLLHEERFIVTATEPEMERETVPPEAILPEAELSEPVLPEAAISSGPETFPEPEISSAPESEPLPSPDPESEAEPVAASPQAEVAEAQPAPETPEPATGAAEAPLAFEPFHTVDYFASQGIKLSQEEVGKDRFGRQLKSFTEWLKTMKRLPQPDAATPLDSSSEQQVTALASESVSSPDVLTEAMAEVWLKQGNRERAREVYRKLSLLHPAKSAYFAAKLDQIQS